MVLTLSEKLLICKCDAYVPTEQLSKGLYALIGHRVASLSDIMNCKCWDDSDVHAAEDVKKISDEEAARDEDALLTYEEHGGLDAKDYINL